MNEEIGFPHLTNAQRERLAICAEEMGEAIQVIGKILRHGFDSHHPDGGPLNRHLLERELGDVRASMIMLCDYGDLSKETIHIQAEAKIIAIRKYLHFM